MVVVVKEDEMEIKWRNGEQIFGKATHWKKKVAMIMFVNANL
jgi:hypothetical protein